MCDIAKLASFGDVPPSILSQITHLHSEQNSVAVSDRIWIACIVLPLPLFVLSILNTYNGKQEAPSLVRTVSEASVPNIVGSNSSVAASQESADEHVLFQEPMYHNLGILRRDMFLTTRQENSRSR